MFGHFGLLLEALRLGLARLVEEFGLEMADISDVEIEQTSLHVFIVQAGHYRAWLSKFEHEEMDCYYADDVEALWT